MTKAEFFMQLQDRLRGLPQEEKQNIIRIYEDLFRQAEESGKSEREIIESFGFQLPPIPNQPPLTGQRLMRRAESGARVVITSVALGLFNLLFVLGPFLAVAASLFTLSLVAILFTFSTFWIILGTGLPTSLTILLLEIFFALMMTGLGVLLTIGMWKVNVGFKKLVIRYVRLNLRLIKGE